ncbi:MAG: hypothetical protein NWQ09_00890 [Nonlabens sp.]|nr:hypothetical protein [Nonlabens sp.]
MITKSLEIRTINYYLIFFIGVIGTVIIVNAFSELGGTELIVIMLAFFLVINYLFRGKLVVERIENVVRFSWRKKPLLASFHQIEIHKNDFIHAHYLRGFQKNQIEFQLLVRTAS